MTKELSQFQLKETLLSWPVPGSRSAQSNEKGQAAKMRGSNKRREERRGKPVTIFLNTSVPASYQGQFALSELSEEACNRARSTSLTGDATSEIAEDDWRRGCLSPLATPPTSRKPLLVSKDKERKKKRNVEMCGVIGFHTHVKFV